jgi:MerR family transcriptional regulator, redox-sensitive transcriptional activator SoxR
MEPPFSIGDVSRRSGLAVTALRFYEVNGLIESTRTAGNQRRYHRGVLRRLAVIQAAQSVGFALTEIVDMLASLPHDPLPDSEHWQQLSSSWRPQLDARIATLERLRDQLDSCIGCGCLTLAECGLLNPGDRAARIARGAAFWKTNQSPTPAASATDE